MGARHDNGRKPTLAAKLAAMSTLVDAFIEALQQTSDWYSEDFADPQ